MSVTLLYFECFIYRMHLKLYLMQANIFILQ